MPKIDFLDLVLGLSRRLQTKITERWPLNNLASDSAGFLAWYFSVFSVLHMIPPFATREMEVSGRQYARIFAGVFGGCRRAAVEEGKAFQEYVANAGILALPNLGLEAEIKAVIRDCPESWIFISAAFEKTISDLAPTISSQLWEFVGTNPPSWLQSHMDWETSYFPRLKRLVDIGGEELEDKRSTIIAASHQAINAVIKTLPYY